jgi:hypothetical protein
MRMNKITTLVGPQAEAIRKWMGSSRMLEYVDNNVDVYDEDVSGTYSC